ncbi:hypothetical protein PIB30_018616 [Stylosanthes scabra]|uniref:Protein kinase domain-containing protein n=1 Tax=Stylosanthes scabra TaxID=79078 RepID=A0ABU6T9Z5_9FABA|nr:hypothetical protein [Stylosanthes scabra]
MRITASALGNKTDQSALLNLKEAVSNDPFGILTSWNSSTHFCSWHGVKCGHRHQRVTELNLQGFHIEGFISHYAGNLSFLRNLYLDNNLFHGNLPPELRRLFRLRTLSLSNNSLEGELPFNLTSCSNLRILRLTGNHFVGEIPKNIESLSKLQVLHIGSNNLTGRIPASIGNLSSLSFIFMSFNHLEGHIPEEIGSLKHLTAFLLVGNKLSGKLPSSFFNLSSLVTIALAENQFSGPLPANMFLDFPNLENIALGLNQFSGSIPPSLSNASRLEIIDFGENYLEGQVPSLENIINLWFLSIELNNLGSNSSADLQFIEPLVNCSNLKELGLADNNFGGILPDFVSNFSTKIDKLTFGDNQIHGKIPSGLGNLINLGTLGLEGNHLTGVIPTSFGRLQNLEQLTLGSNKLSGDMPESIGNLSKLLILDLSYNMFKGNIPSTIGNCKNLIFLHLSMNNLSGAIPLQLFQISTLAILLDLSFNSLSGVLPGEVGILKNIEAFNVSENYLSGSIPSTIGECLSLESLYLQGNSFNGTIPSSLGSLKGLQELDLSRNKLSGTIPEELQSIPTLQYFNASFNMLQGNVPTKGIFKNASSVSLTNNGRLCGGIPELKLPPCPLKESTKRTPRHIKMKALIAALVAFFLCSCILAMYYLMKKRPRKASHDNSTIAQLPMVSYQSLHHATNGFSSENLIGVGSMGSVYRGNLESQEKVVAVKVLNLQKAGAHKSFIAECNAFRNIRHRNLVKIYTCCSSTDYNRNDFKALVFEYVENGSLEDWLHPTRGTEDHHHPRILNLKERLEIVTGVASALYYLHYECEQPVIHCDLKPSNVLLGDNMVAQVSDFGLARLISAVDGNSQNQTSTSGIKGTIGYAPPEYGTSSQVSIEGDTYSFGILVLEMLTGKRPTDEMFKDGHSLHNYVHDALPNNILEIVDATLLSMMDQEIPTVTIAEEENHVENAGLLQSNVEKCLFSLFKIGLACSVDPPKERMNMMQVKRELNIIKNAFHS